MEFAKQLFLSSAVMQGLLAVLLAVVVCYLYSTGQEVPEALVGMLGVVLGFYFRTKGTAEGIQIANKK